ncbi:MAG: lysophospholipid transporter LplT [Betaproteobacteria bacterium]|jgi:MFS family permease|nr:lysophospholipid transporter LplT [Pseudomonadota bacterium]NBO02739.1 lysophospholipid transporter LplT [Betaproteobacteria bacterium]NDG04541.1 lysophospholipid transporter LplT [Alphaproteobacteria bacterium]NBP34120.1 lysophospholipid transporter LplT [Betaproteobacteria bacterium]NBP37374.1 lysophospholipid transporter LplT [Betaproteobacteria bacterium]
MKKGFYTIMAAQFFSSLADNALLISAIALLIEMAAPEWMKPMLKLFFTVSYVVLAPFVGAFADAMPKGKVMFYTNAIKVLGCALMFASVHPLLAYAVVGLGAAAYSPAKYGILTELLPPSKLVAANGWIEGTTVGSIILGTVVGGALISPSVSNFIVGLGIPGVSSAATGAIVVIGLIYLLAALINLRIPDTGARYEKQHTDPFVLIKAFWRCNKTLWQDKLGQISLAVTTLFWGAGAVLQFIVLEWAKQQLGMPLNRAAILQGVVALGIAVGAVLAARFITLRQSPRVLPLGIAMGVLVPSMTLVTSLPVSYPLLILVGGLAGFFVVPMNALLQHRGHVLMSAGHSIAVQNFNENLNVLFMLGLYALLLKFELHINAIIILFGAFVAITMLLVRQRYLRNAQAHDLRALILDHAKH